MAKTALGTLGALLLLGGCADILGLNDFQAGDAGTAGSGTTSSGTTSSATTSSSTTMTGGSGGATTTSSSSTGGSGGATTTSSSSTGGSGGATTTSSTMTGGSGGGALCTPNEVRACAYGGPAGTDGVGLCKAATQTCATDGMSFGACTGEVTPKLELCTTLGVDEDCDGLAACSGAYRWGKIAGDAATQAGKGVAIDAQGNVVMVGQFASKVDLGGTVLDAPTSVDPFVWKLDRQGKSVWSKSFPLTGDQVVNAMALDASGAIAIIGTSTSGVDFGSGPLPFGGGTDAFVAVLEADGTLRFAKMFGSSADDAAKGVAFDKSGSVILVGHLGGVANFDGSAVGVAGDQNAFVAKLSGTNGAVTWAKGYGSTGADTAEAVATDSQSNIFVTGAFATQIDFGTGTTSGANDGFLVKLGPGGFASFTKFFAAMTPLTGTSVAIDNADNVILAASGGGGATLGGATLGTAGINGGFVAKLGPGGGHKWSTWLGNATITPRVTTDAANNIVVAATFNNGSLSFGGASLANPSTVTADWAVGKLDTAGAHVRSRAYGDAASQVVGGVACGPTGEIAITGASGGSPDFGGGPLASAGGSDAVLTLFAP